MKLDSSSRIPFLGLVIVLFAAGSGIARAACPPLLVLERSTNKNRVWYEISGPSSVTAKWEMREKGPGVWEDLTTLERSRAYGARTFRVPEGTAFSIAGVPSVRFRIERSARDECPVARYEDATGDVIAVRKVELVLRKSLVPAIDRVWFVGDSARDGRTVRLPIAL